MSAADVTVGSIDIKITFFPEEATVWVEIEWGNLTYAYRGEWNPGELRYENGSYQGLSEGSDLIRVTSKSCMPVKVTLEYESLEGYSDILGKFRHGQLDPDSSLEVNFPGACSPISKDFTLELTSNKSYYDKPSIFQPGMVTITVDGSCEPDNGG